MKEKHTCQFAGCGKRLPSEKPGQQTRRKYCCDAHKLLANRGRQRVEQQEQIRLAWQMLPQDSRVYLEQIMTHYGPVAAHLALSAIKASYRNNTNVFQLLRHFSLEEKS